MNEKEFQEQIISHIDYRMDQMERLELRSFRELKKLVDAYSENLIFVFEIDKATIIQKRKFLEENISYYVKRKELFISK